MDVSCHMRNVILKSIVLLSFLSCNYFSKDRAGKRIRIKHVSVSRLPMICEGDMGSFKHLTDSLLFKSDLRPEVTQIIRDSIAVYYPTDKIKTSIRLIDEVTFPKVFLENFDKARDVDSIKIIISRIFDNMHFSSYGFLYSNDLKDFSADRSTRYNGYWEIGDELVKIKADAVTKKLYFETRDGKKKSIPGVTPSRMFSADIRFKEKLVVYYTNKEVDSITVVTPQVEHASHVARFAENLEEAKSL
jgi:hypothetical protein